VFNRGSIIQDWVIEHNFKIIDVYFSIETHSGLFTRNTLESLTTDQIAALARWQSASDLNSGPVVKVLAFTNITSIQTVVFIVVFQSIKTLFYTKNHNKTTSKLFALCSAIPLLNTFFTSVGTNFCVTTTTCFYAKHAITTLFWRNNIGTAIRFKSVLSDHPAYSIRVNGVWVAHVYWVPAKRTWFHCVSPKCCFNA
jgi:hypothetical protein